MTLEVYEESREGENEVEETTDQNAPADETNASDSQLSEESKTHEEEDVQDDSLEESGVDYKAELEREKNLREKAEKKIVKLKKAQKRNDEDSGEESDSPDNLVEKVAERIRQENSKELIDEILEEISSNSNERDLIEFIYENKIVKSGFTRKSIAEDLTAAKILANRKKIERENKELNHALKIKSTLNTSPQFSGKKFVQSEAQQKMNAQEKKLLQWAQKFKKSN